MTLLRKPCAPEPAPPPPRFPRDRGWARESAMARGPNGRLVCRCGCAREVPRGRRTFYGDDCVHGWKLRTDPAYQAKHVFERDLGVCAVCRVDTVVAQQRLRLLWRDAEVAARAAGTYWNVHYAEVWWPVAHRAFLVELERLGWSLRRSVRGHRPWDMDHERPVSEGGGSCGIENLRTLCPRCHADATRALRGRLAARRRGITG